MTEEESRKALFALHYEYMQHKPEERLKMYNDYIAKRNKIKEELAKTIIPNKSDNN